MVRRSPGRRAQDRGTADMPDRICSYRVRSLTLTEGLTFCSAVSKWRTPTCSGTGGRGLCGGPVQRARGPCEQGGGGHGRSAPPNYTDAPLVWCTSGGAVATSDSTAVCDGGRGAGGSGGLSCGHTACQPPLPLCDSPSGGCFFTGPWTVTRSSLRMLRRVAAF